MNCKNCRQRLEEWLDGSLAESARFDLEAHLRSCSDCSRSLERRRVLGHALSQAMNELTAGLHFQPPPQAMPPTTTRFSRPLRQPRFTPARLMALAAASLIVLLFLFQPWSRMRRDHAAAKGPIAEIAVSDSLGSPDESIISGRFNGYTYSIHLEMSAITLADRS